jgi:hypothetical protein
VNDQIAGNPAFDAADVDDRLGTAQPRGIELDQEHVGGAHAANCDIGDGRRRVGFRGCALGE